MNETSRLVLVTGATGSVGPVVVSAFREAGFRVRILARNAATTTALSPEVDVFLGDITNPSTVSPAMCGVNLVVHMAALLHIVNPPSSLRQNYEEINVEGTANIIRAALSSGVRRVLFFSSIAVYGNSCGDIITESTIPRPDTLYAQTKFDAERVVINAKRPDGQPLGTVLRLAAVYGSRVSGNYRRLLLSLAKHRFVPIGAGLNRRTLIYDQDVATAAVMAVSHPLAAGRVYNVSDGRFHTLNEIISAMCEALGRKPPALRLPITPVRVAAGLLGRASAVTGFASTISGIVEKYTEDIPVSSKLIQDELGFTPEFDLAAGWRQTVRQMREARIL